MSRKNFVGFEIQMGEPVPTFKRESPTMTIGVASFFWMLVGAVALALLMYVVGVWTGTNITRQTHPTAHVEVQSDAKGANDEL